MQTDGHKAELRERLLERRAALDPAARRPLNTQITNRLLALLRTLRPQSVFIYVATVEEVSTRPLIDALLDDAVTVLVPKLINRTEMNAVRFPTWESMVPGPLGILAPADNVAFQGKIDVAVVPGLGFSPEGDRLGFGAGYYDRWLGSRPHVTKIGVAFDFQIVDAIPRSGHDIPMDFLITETRTVEIKAL